MHYFPTTKKRDRLLHKLNHIHFHKGLTGTNLLLPFTCFLRIIKFVESHNYSSNIYTDF